jgi:hypothetical protein
LKPKSTKPLPIAGLDVEDQITRGNIELNDEGKMKLTDDEKTAHSNAWRTHRETTESLKKSRGKIYSLLPGQCTLVSSAG